MKLRNPVFMMTAMALWCMAATGVQSAVLWDYSPDGTASGVTDDYFGPFFNRADLQFFAEIVRFESAVMLNGMDIYDPIDADGSMPHEVTIRIWPDAAGRPAESHVEFQSPISAVDFEGTTSLAGFQRVHTSFETPVTLAANAYWISMSGFDNALGQLTLNDNAPGDSRVFVFDTQNNLALLTASHIGDMAFRLHGVTAVPLSGAAMFLYSGLFALAGLPRRRNQSAHRSF